EKITCGCRFPDGVPKTSKHRNRAEETTHPEKFEKCVLNTQFMRNHFGPKLKSIDLPFGKSANVDPRKVEERTANKPVTAPSKPSAHTTSGNNALGMPAE